MSIFKRFILSVLNWTLIKVKQLRKFYPHSFIPALRLATAKRNLQRFAMPYKLNIGCGKIKFDDWINIDREGDHQTVDVFWDVTRKFRFLDGDSCSAIYCEHFLEHITPVQANSFLSECYRVLQPNGILRIAMPSLDFIIEKYSSDDWRDQDWLGWPEYQFIKTKAEMLNIAFRWWEHEWLYDREELHRRLRDSGFQELTDADWRCSEYAELRERESRKDSVLIVEAKK